MTDTLALEKLYDDVSARFTAEGTPAKNVFGWRTPAQQVVGNRIAWIPGDPSGNAGQDGPARNPGRNPRPIGTFVELFTVDISGSDPSAPENELVQYKATRLLRDAWHRAVYLAAHGTFSIKSEAWIIDKKERRFGAAMRLICTIDSMVPDEPLTGAPTDARAVIELSELDDDESFETAPAPASVTAATTAPITLSGAQSIDDAAALAGELVLVKDQADPTENGVYVVSIGAWTRAPDVLVHGYFLHVELGTVNGGSGWELATPNPIVVGTTPLAFERVSP